MAEPRDLTKVIDELLVAIPETERELRAGLKSIAGRIPYTAPELQGNMWHETARVLANAIPHPKLPWHIEAARIFTGVPYSQSQPEGAADGTTSNG